MDEDEACDPTVIAPCQNASAKTSSDACISHTTALMKMPAYSSTVMKESGMGVDMRQWPFLDPTELPRTSPAGCTRSWRHVVVVTVAAATAVFGDEEDEEEEDEEEDDDEADDDEEDEEEDCDAVERAVVNEEEVGLGRDDC